MTTYAPTTELEAVNVMLGTIGESPVSTLSTDGFSDVVIATQILAEVSREIQSQQWDCNHETDYELTPDNDGFIAKPENTLKIDITSDYAASYSPVVRGTRLYDKKNHTFIFPEAITFDITWYLPFTDLPETLRRYITISAARKFQKRFYSSETIDGFNAEDEAVARANALSDDGYVADYNMNMNYSVYDVLTR